MLGNIFHSALPETLTRNLGELYLGQARTEKEKGHLDVALTLYDQVKETLKSLGSVKEALRKAQDPRTLADETLRAMIANAYFERGEVLESLNFFDKARASYLKAEKWGHYEAKHRVEALRFLSGHSFHSSFPASAQTATSASNPLQQVVASAAQEKSVLVDYLFEKALSTLGSIEVSNKPSLFLVYAHDNRVYGEAKADISKYLINKLSKIRGVKLYSDQTPMGQLYSDSPEHLKEDDKLEDILTNQLCLLPTRLIKNIKPVDKVVACCSAVLGSYLTWQYYGDFYQELQKAYREDREAYLSDSEQRGTLAIREVVRKFSQGDEYKAGFHHVLTEIAFLQIRAEHLKGQHGIIPVSLTPTSYESCLAHFIPATTVRMEDVPRFEEQAQAGREVPQNQSRHWVLFKLIERLLVGSDEAKTFLNKFWDGYSNCISRLKSDLTLGQLEFAELLDSIFDGIRTALHSQLASTVQQQHHQLRLLNADPKVALKEQYFAALKQDEAFNETQQLYVEPRGKASMKGKAGIFPLLSKVQEFLNDKQVILLTGDSGAGKTTLSRLLEAQLWSNKNEHDEKEPDAIPLFISLASIDKPEHDLIAKALRKRGLSEFQIQKLNKEEQRFVFILDGYDEIRQTQNLYLSNSINQPNSWQGQMVISCRSEYLGRDYQSRFQPNPNLQDKDALFQEVVIEPFSEEERTQYLEKYVKHNSMSWAAQRYQEALEQPHLKALVSNPFLLRVVLEALPYLENEGKDRSVVQLRLDLYDQFVRSWFDRNQQRLSTQDLTGAKEEIFRELCDDGFAQHGIGFVKELAVHLYTENAGKPAIEYSLFKDEGNWKEAFFGREAKQQLLREAWPLSRSGNQYRFIHKSLLEYFVARSLFDSFDAFMEPSTRQRRGSGASAYSFESQPVLPLRTLRDVSLAPKHWVSDLGVMRWLTERVQQEATFKKQLLAIIECSKTDAGVRQAAANAMTILVKSGEQFNGADLKGIQIPGADLSDGVLDSAQLQGVDLRRVNLRNIWLCQANLSGAQMAGVQFGEWPFLQEDGGVVTCVYSPDRKSFAVGLQSGTISLYNISNWVKIHTLSGHTGWVKSVVYSPNGQRIASGGWDHTVRLWDVQTGQLVRPLRGHTDKIFSVVYSPNGKQIASGSWDKTVRLWDVQTGQLGHTLRGHTDKIFSVMYSPNGQQIASSGDKIVRLWDTQSGQLSHTLSGHTGSVKSVAYSSSGEQIASSGDKIVRLWDAQSGQLRHTLSGHTDKIFSIVYSPNGEQITSGSYDKTVRLWDAQTGQPGHVLSGHTNSVESVVYSPDGEQVVSCSKDNTVRLWYAQTGQLSRILSGHTDSVKSVVYSPDGQQIASCSWDKTVRLWDAQTGLLNHTLSGHTQSVKSVVHSPNGQQIASASQDKSVRLWDAQTGQLHHTLRGHINSVENVAYSPNGLQIASSEGETVRLWDAQTGQLNSNLIHNAWVNSVVYSPNGRQIASGTGEYAVNLWDEQIGQFKFSRSLRGHTGSVMSVVYSPNGEQIASGSSDYTVRLWDTQNDQLIHTLHGHTQSVKSVVYSANGHQIASASYDKTVRLWDAQTGQLSHTLSGHTSSVSSIVYSPNGEQIASCCNENVVRLWDAQSGQLSHTLSGHIGSVNSVAYSPSGEQIASGSHDKTVRLWNVTSGQCQWVIQDFNGKVNSVAWKATPDIQYLVTGSEDKSVRQWEVKKDGEDYKVILFWSTTHEILTVRGIELEGVEGLSPLNKKLLKQRGAAIASLEEC